MNFSYFDYSVPLIPLKPVVVPVVLPEALYFVDRKPATRAEYLHAFRQVKEESRAQDALSNAAAQVFLASPSKEGDVGHAPMPVAAAPNWTPAALVCSTCNGSGEIDETLGGGPTADPHCKCPDCDGLGEHVPELKAGDFVMCLDICNQWEPRYFREHDSGGIQAGREPVQQSAWWWYHTWRAPTKAERAKFAPQEWIFSSGLPNIPLGTEIDFMRRNGDICLKHLFTYGGDWTSSGEYGIIGYRVVQP